MLILRLVVVVVAGVGADDDVPRASMMRQRARYSSSDGVVEEGSWSSLERDRFERFPLVQESWM